MDINNINIYIKQRNKLFLTLKKCIHKIEEIKNLTINVQSINI